MIQRIKNIKGIGVFRDFRGGGAVPIADTNKISVIFGRNMLGKTTLSKIFESLATNNPTLIQERASIPPGASAPSVQLDYLNRMGKVKILNYRSSSWESNDLNDRLYVFGQDFIHRNLITGLEVTRVNREEFTDFVLGEEGVKLSREIEDKKKELRGKKSDLEKIKPSFAAKQQWSEQKTKDYSELKVDWSINDLEKQREAAKKSLMRLENIEEFTALPAFSPLAVEALKSFESLQKDIDEMSKMSYRQVTDQIKERVLGHIKKHCKDEEKATLWLKQGLEWIEDGSCPFCSQQLDPVGDLIETFQKMFDQAFKDYEKSVQKAINNILDQVDSLMAFSPVTQTNEALQAARKYQPFLDDISTSVQSLEEFFAKIQEAEITIRKFLNEYKKSVINAINEKKAQPHNSIKVDIDSKKMKDSYKVIDDLFKKVNSIIKNLSLASEAKKKDVEGIKSTQLNQEKKLYEEQLMEVDKKQARIEDSKDCEKYSKVCKEIDYLLETISEKQEELEKDQSDYLKKYFKSLNALFRELGSNDFDLFLESSDRGDKKTVFLKVKYHGQEIQHEHLHKVFSESDKRSLALAIFICKVKHIQEKEKAVLILDDPVISFDDNRVGHSIRLFKDLSDDFSQVILLSHYKLLVDKLYNPSANVYYLAIKTDSGSSVLRKLDVHKFTLTPHERAFEEIMSFINGDDSVDVRRSLRPFMEDHLKLLYAKQIVDNNLDLNRDFGLIINDLCACGCFADDIKQDLHRFRESFNPDHHTAPIDDNPEETRLNASNLFQLLYEGLN